MKFFLELFRRTIINTNKTSYFFILLSVFSVVCIFVFDIQVNTLRVEDNNTSRFELFGFNYYRILPDGVDMFVIGNRAIEDINGSYKLDNFQIQYLSNGNNNEKIESEFAIYDNSLVYFPKGVYYYKDNMKLWSSSAYYNPKLKEIDGLGKFVISSDAYNIIGDNIRYKNNKIYANNIHSRIKMEN